MSRSIVSVSLALLLLGGALSASAQQPVACRDHDRSEEKAPDAYVAGFGVGVMENITTEANEFAYHFTVGKLWSSNRWFSMKVNFEAVTEFDNAILATGVVGANIYPTFKYLAPYLGAAFGIGYLHVEEDVAVSSREDWWGVDFNATFGVQFLEGRPFALAAEGVANILLREIATDTYPMTYGGRVLLLF
jgi:opacity protein-like surface antigen